LNFFGILKRGYLGLESGKNSKRFKCNCACL
jgi:hypothetical protein